MSNCPRCGALPSTPGGFGDWVCLSYELEGSFVQSDACRLCRANRQVRELETIVDRLPKTADGVPVVPGMEVWVPCETAGYWGQKPGKAVKFMVDWIRSQGTPIHLQFVQGQPYQILAERCYSTREVAEAAGGGDE